MLIIRSWPCPKCNFMLLHTTLNLKASKGGWGGSPEKRPYDVFHGQNRYVTLPLDLVDTQLHN